MMTNGFYCLRDISAPAKVLLTMAIPNIDAAIKRQQERAEQQSKRGKREGKRAGKKHFANERNYTAEQLNKMLGDTTNFDDI